ncbi:aldose epimerase family protein [Echinimonas agarilytica]|uniref:Aldose 1-epimerase n=1 Tax=Echinimonas agarilytica TaxID=1215918 RepID=A0AA42B6Z6_9GAMM|nr:aldose epimerase family protein [Echinimonas agarilytica]MCM2679046.1 galactose mutarotase [Echinimonas agarilytica]
MPHMSDAPSSNSSFYCLKNKAGVEVELIPLGARVGAIRFPIDGQLTNLALSYDNISDYEKDPFFIGTTAGRFANRICEGRFEIDGEEFQLPLNDGHNSLHGGPGGFHTKVWQVEQRSATELTFLLQSPDGDQGYPGTLNVQVKYSLSEDSKIEIEFSATTNQPTIINLCNHAYFNLGATNIKQLELMMSANQYLPIYSDGIPEGLHNSVVGTSLDFMKAKSLAGVFDHLDDVVKARSGFDHALILCRPQLDHLSAQLKNPENGMHLDLYTDQPSLQIYSGQYLDTPFQPFGGICLEAQGCPDAPNKPYFPSALLRPGQGYKRTVVYHFYQK